MKKLAVLVLMLAFSLCQSVLAQDPLLTYGTSDPGVSKSIPIWGLDTAWLDGNNVRRGVIYMGQPQVDVIRFSFTGDTTVSGGNLTGTGLTEFNQRMAIVNAYTDSHTALYLNNDTEILNGYYQGSGGVNASTWAQLIDVTRSNCVAAGRAVLSVAPFNEPDFATWQGTSTRLGEVCTQLRTTYSANFSGIRLCGGSTLNDDQAAVWYNPLSGILDEGNTHQLAGNFDNYAAFYQTVEANGDFGANDELHNVMEAMVGAEYGMDAGIWWGTAERARGDFVKASDGQRLAYAEDRPSWTAASVYRGPNGAIQAFVGESERQSLPKTYRFFSKDRDVFYDGDGPRRDYAVTTTGDGAYGSAAHHNAERVINITWGSDVQPLINGRYILVARHSLKAMEVAGNSALDGANIQQNTYTGGLNQQWDVAPLSSTNGGDYSYFRITAAHSGKAPDVNNFSYDDGGNVQQWTYGGGGGPNQQWFLEYVSNGWFNVRCRFSGKYLDVSGGETATQDGANIQQWSSTGGLNQQWRFVPVGASPTDVAAPAVVTGVSALANARSVQLTWNASGASDLGGYTVLRSATSGGPYEIVARGLTNTSFTDKFANETKAYFYVVKAVDKSWNASANSAQVSATPTGVPALIARYAFDANTTDSSINGNHPVFTSGSTSYGPSQYGFALDLNGTSQFMMLPANMLAGVTDFTIGAWVNWDGGNAWQRIFDFGNDTTQYMFLTPNSGGGTLRFAISGGGAEQQINAPALPVGQWVHVTVTRTGTTGRLYTNGVLAASSTMTTTPASFNPALNYLGKSQFANDPLFNGRLDEFAVYNYALNDSEVLALVNAAPYPPVKLTGTVIGSPGSWNGQGNTINNAFDNNLGTYYDAANASGDWAGLDFGSAKVIKMLNFCPRTGFAGRMVGGVFQAANVANFSSGVVTLFTVTAAPTEGAFTSQIISDTGSYRYVRYVGPANGYCNVAEIEFYEGGTPSTPAVPTGLAAVPGNNQVSLSWATSAGATSYNVKRSTTSGGPYSTIGSPTSASFTDTTAVNGTTYFYVVSAVNGVGESANSSQVSATPATVPATPTGLAATPGNNQVGLTWSSASGATSYNVKRSTTSGGPYSTIGSPTATSFTDTTAVNGITYFYVVSGVNAAGQSADSTQVSATPQAPPPPTPTSLAATPGNNQVGLTWSASSGATSYNVKRSTTSGGPYSTIGSPTATSFTDTTAVNGTTYFYVVSAVNSGGESANSTQVSATPTLPVPSTPTGLAATPGDSQVGLTWSASSGAASYNVKRSTTSGGPYSTIGSPTATSFTDTTVVNDTTYFYVVSAFNASGESANSSQVSATPSTSLPSPWVTEDIGAVAATGSASYSGGTFTVSGSGADIWDTADEFRYVYQPSSGNCEMRARVATIQNTDPWAKSGVMIRESTAPGSRWAAVFITPNNGVTFQWRATTGGACQFVQVTGITAPRYVRIQRAGGNSFRGYYSSNGSNWTQIGGNQNIGMSSSTTIGLAVTSHNDGTLCTSTLDSITATP